MKIKNKHKWIHFNCHACGKPGQVLMGTYKEVVCSCGCLLNINELLRENESKTKKESNNI